MRGISGEPGVVEKKPAATSFDDVKKQAARLCEDFDADVFFYNGGISRSNVLHVMEEIRANKCKDSVILILITYGGDPHAAFKVSRYIQDRYSNFSLFVPGYCKSAGTLYAVAANEIIFAPFGELGPLDVQMVKPDHFQYDSGLVIGESLDTLERRAIATFKRMFEEIVSESQGQFSINTAMNAASELTKSIYAPIMSRIDPEEIGARQRALRIALDYGLRLSVRSQNTTDHALIALAEKYSSHSFVIDKEEAALLFKQVRPATEQEMHLASLFGPLARFEQPGNREPIFTALHKRPQAKKREEGSSDEALEPGGDSPSDGADSQGADGPPLATPKNPRRKGRSRGMDAAARGRGKSTQDRTAGSPH
jgi:Serine dehydrogenase proteinase